MISVFTPTHKPQNLLRALESLKAQTYQDFEWVILVNNTTEEIPEEVRSYEKTRIIFDFTGRKEIGYLKKTVCSHCKGGTIAELDHDDALEPDALEIIDLKIGVVDFVYSSCYEYRNGFTCAPYSTSFGWDYTTGVDKRIITHSFPINPASLGYIWYAPNHVRAWRKSFYDLIGGHSEMDVCHKVGTKMFFDKEWINVEAHPSCKKTIRKNGFEISLWGLPFTETVTTEHRYWTKGGWKEAHEITKNDWIGFRIEQAESVDFKNYDHSTFKIKHKGRCLDFTDNEWWWFFGLWWGDGWADGKSKLNISINNRDTHILDRCQALLNKYGVSSHVNKKDGCVQLVLSHPQLSAWLKSWRIGNSRKNPPEWIQGVAIEKQKFFIRGYIDADGFVDKKLNQVRLTSIHLDGLLFLRRLLFRTGIASSIRHGMKAGPGTIMGRNINCQKKYDLRFRLGADKLGYDLRPPVRHKVGRCHVSDGFAWYQIKNKRQVSNEEFAPIKTKGSVYLTEFGLSHNCDDHELCIRTYLNGDVKFIDLPLYQYHGTGDNTSAGEKNAKIQQVTVDLHDKYIEQICLRWSELNNLKAVDVCCHANKKEGFIGVDKYSHPNVDIVADLDESFPFEDNSVGVFRFQDAIEHLKDPIKTMSEVYRCLAVGGMALIEVPSTDGRGAFQDPTHVSFWNSNSFWYYTKKETAQYINTPVRFQLNRIWDYFPTEWHKTHNIVYTRAHLVKLGGDRIAGGKEI